MKRRLLAAAVMAAALPCLGTAQQAPRLIWVQVVVTDAAGRLVTSLRRDDFTILTDGKPNDITVFSMNEMPMAMSMMLDVSLSLRTQTMPVRRAAALIVDEFVRGDRVNIGVFDRAIQVSERFTANRPRIFWSLEQPITAAQTPCEAKSGTLPPASRMQPGPPPQIGGGGTSMWDAIWCGVRELQRDTESIRKVMLLITDGMENSSVTDETAAIRFAQATGVVIYAVGFRGTEGAPTQSAPVSRADRRLRDLAQATGGRFFPIEEKEPLEPVFKTIGEELRGQYVLGFEPRSTAGKLQVQVRSPELNARAQVRYSRLGR